MPLKLPIKERSHSYWLDCGDVNVKKVVWYYLKTITSKKKVTEGRITKEVYDQTYATKSPCGRYVGILKPCLPDMLTFLKERLRVVLEPVIEKEPLHDFVPVTIPIVEGTKPKDDEQKEAEEFVLRKDANMSTLECRTGFGKTYLGLVTTAKKGMLTAFIMQAQHIKTWLREAPNFLVLDKGKDVYIVQGRDTLVRMIRYKKEGKLDDIKSIYISSETFREYIKAYEAGEEYCDVSPLDFCAYFGIGRVVRDEAHEALYTLVRQTIYLNVHDILALSATIVASDYFTKRMHVLAFPKECRWKSENNKHIEAVTVHYTNEFGVKLRCNTPFGYNHTTYEKNFIRNARLRRQYFKMLSDVMVEFDKNGKPGMKTMFFFALKDMCYLFKEYLSAIYPDRNIGVYVQETNPDDLYKFEFIITTIGSAGTGVDIPDLARLYSTVAIGSQRKAWQSMGRLRALKNYPGEFPRYYFFSNMSLPAHRKFEQMRRYDLQDKTKSVAVLNLGVTLTKY